MSFEEYLNNAMRVQGTVIPDGDVVTEFTYAGKRFLSEQRVREVLDKWGNISLENNTLTELIKEDLGLK